MARKCMETSEAIAQMRARADQIARLVTELHPLTPSLGRPEVQGEILRALFELTKQGQHKLFDIFYLIQSFVIFLIFFKNVCIQKVFL